MKTIEEKEARSFSGIFTAFILCIIAATPIMCWGNGLIQGYTTFEAIRTIFCFLIVGSIGYSIGRFTSLYKWFGVKK